MQVVRSVDPHSVATIQSPALNLGGELQSKGFARLSAIGSIPSLHCQRLTPRCFKDSRHAAISVAADSQRE